MSRSTKIVGFSVPPTMVEEIEEVAKEESRTKSELFREMFRVYKRYRKQQELFQDNQINLVKQAREEQITSMVTKDELLKESKSLAKYGSEQANKVNIKQKDVNNLIYGYRKQKSS